MKNKCGLFALLFALSSIVSFTAFSNNASAASPFDDFIKTTDRLLINGQEPDFAAVLDVLESQCGVTDINPVSAITYLTGPVGMESIGFIMHDEQINIDFELNGVYVNQNVHSYMVYEYGGLRCTDYGKAPRNDLTFHESGTRIYHTSNIHVVYPQDYEGELLPESDTAAGIIKPNFEWDIARRQITLKFNAVDGLEDDYKYGYAINRIGDLGEDIEGINYADTQPLFDGYTSWHSSRTFQMPSNGHYIVGVGVVKADALEDDTLEESIYPGSDMFWLQLRIDGTFYSGTTLDTEELECTSDVVGGIFITRCVQELFTDCSAIYEGNLIGGFGCQLMNVLKSWTSHFKAMFFPDMYAFHGRITEFQDFFNQKLGFIADSTHLLYMFFDSLIAGANNPSCNLNTGSLDGKQINISLCNVRNMIGATTFDFALNIFRGVIAIGFVFTSYRLLLAFFANKREVTM